MERRGREVIDRLLSDALYNRWPHDHSKFVPLVSTSYNIDIHNGLVVVEELRKFVNLIEENIEATMTLLMPIHAVFYDLRLFSNEQTFVADALPKHEASDLYESTILDSHLSVHHELVIPGIHKLSVGNIPPHTTLAVSTSWVTSLAHDGVNASVRIPVTVGDIYGTSPLFDCDDVHNEEVVLKGDVSIKSDSGTFLLNGSPYLGATETMSLDRPIDIEVLGADYRPCESSGREGYRSVVEIEPVGGIKQAPIRAAVLLDLSASMNDACSSDDAFHSKHDVVQKGLRAAAETLCEDDELSLSEFNDRTTAYQKTTGPSKFLKTLDNIGSPNGGTELDEALQFVAELPSSPRDILILTDGKTFELDIQRLIESGKRFSAVVVGEDSLDAVVGRLVAISGGQLFVANQPTTSRAIISTLNALRTDACEDVVLGRDEYVKASWLRSGMKITVTRSYGDGAIKFDQAIMAFSTQSVLPHLSRSSAEKVALEEGIITPLTSLYLYDPATPLHCIFTRTKKIPLMRPATSGKAVRQRCSDQLSDPSMTPLDTLLNEVTWKEFLEGETLLKEPVCKLASTPDMKKVAQDDEVIALADKLNVAPDVLAVAMLARSKAFVDRYAKTAANKLIGPINVESVIKLNEVASCIGIKTQKVNLEKE